MSEDCLSFFFASKESNCCLSLTKKKNKESNCWYVSLFYVGYNVLLLQLAVCVDSSNLSPMCSKLELAYVFGVLCVKTWWFTTVKVELLSCGLTLSYILMLFLTSGVPFTTQE